ncbi:hypothetical protein Efla_006262 [Eimeria flavescens]
MAKSEVNVAGVPSERLSQLKSPQPAVKPRRECLLPDHAAFKDGMSAVLRPNLPVDDRDSSSSTRGFSSQSSQSLTPVSYAGKPTFRINNSVFNHGIKKQSPDANKSKQIAAVFSSDSQEPKVAARLAFRRLKDYCPTDRLGEVFCTKFHVADPLTGRTEIMTARRPGKATAEMNISEFDGYLLPPDRAFSLKKAKDNIDHSLLGLMPKPNKEAKFLATTVPRQPRAPTLECKDSWMTPAAHAAVCKPLGPSRRISAFPWSPSRTDHIAHLHTAAGCLSPRFSRACIRPAIS